MQNVNTYKEDFRRKSGFTLIELLAVVAVILVLMGLVVGMTGYVKTRSKVAHAKAEMQELLNELEDYKLTNGTYPDELIDIRGKLPDGFRFNAADDGIMDPWEEDYVYGTSGPESCNLYSTGPRLDTDADDIYPGK